MTKKILKMMNKSIGDLERYEFTADGFSVISTKEHTNISWDKVSKILELKPGFLIQFTRAYYYIIPKRCFKDSEELNEFLDFIYLVLDRKKLKLEKYKFDEFFTDYGEIVYPKQVVTEATESKTPIIEINFKHKKMKC